MASVALQEIAFKQPGGEHSISLDQRPIDLVHLARQTSGDRALEMDILCLFRQQLSVCMSNLIATSGRERTLIAHTLKGSARSIGAFSLSRLAERIEETPSDAALIKTTQKEVNRVHDFIVSLSR